MLIPRRMRSGMRRSFLRGASGPRTLFNYEGRDLPVTAPLPIHPISMPTPWAPVGPIHTYLIRQDPITLIDTGLDVPGAREILQSGLGELGLSLRDIRRVLLTHAHLDHYGLAAWVQGESGAEVWLHPDEVGKLETPDWWLAGRAAILAEAGASEEVQEVMNRFWELGRRLALPLADWRPLTGAQRFLFEDGALDVVHLPGHALGHCGFWDEQGRVLLGGDHLLDGVTPNPILEPLPPGHPAAAPHSPARALTLGLFLESLERAAALPAQRVLPGHGQVIVDHRAVERGYRQRHEAKLESLRARLGDGLSAYQLTQLVYPRTQEFNIFLALSEVLAHLDLLLVRGRARSEFQGPVRIYQPE